MLTIISLGAGVQSTTLALMAARGEIDPAPDCAIFADTQWEPRAVYEHLGWLRSPGVLPFPVHIITAGSIRSSIRLLPWFTVNPDGSKGMGRRQCTGIHKRDPITREVRRLLGKGPRDRIPPGSANVLIGISQDEAHRMKPARAAYMVNRYPLVDLGMSRDDCLVWLEANDYPKPPKSACIGCPFHARDYWLQMHDHRPDEWLDAVTTDRGLRNGVHITGLRGTCYMHPDRVPLDQVDLAIAAREPDAFGNECEGLCGV